MPLSYVSQVMTEQYGATLYLHVLVCECKYRRSCPVKTTLSEHANFGYRNALCGCVGPTALYRVAVSSLLLDSRNFSRYTQI